MTRVLITRPRAQSAEFAEQLRIAGFEPVHFPVIEIRPADDLSALKAALANIGRYAWVVFTSVNAVEVVFSVLSNHLIFEKGQEVKVAAVGKKTADALRLRGSEPQLVPDEFVGEAIVPGMGELKGKHILLPRAEMGRAVLPEAIRAAGGIVDEITVYHTLPVKVDADGLDALRTGVDWVTFTSPSTVQNFSKMARQHKLDPLNLPGSPKIACIGPITEKAAQDNGFVVTVTADEYTTDRLIEALSDQANNQTGEQAG